MGQPWFQSTKRDAKHSDRPLLMKGRSTTWPMKDSIRINGIFSLGDPCLPLDYKLVYSLYKYQHYITKFSSRYPPRNTLSS